MADDGGLPGGKLWPRGRRVQVQANLRNSDQGNTLDLQQSKRAGWKDDPQPGLAPRPKQSQFVPQPKPHPHRNVWARPPSWVEVEGPLHSDNSDERDNPLSLNRTSAWVLSANGPHPPSAAPAGGRRSTAPVIPPPANKRSENLRAEAKSFPQRQKNAWGLGRPPEEQAAATSAPEVVADASGPRDPAPAHVVVSVRRDGGVVVSDHDLGFRPPLSATALSASSVWNSSQALLQKTAVKRTLAPSDPVAASTEPVQRQTQEPRRGKREGKEKKVSILKKPQLGKSVSLKAKGSCHASVDADSALLLIPKEKKHKGSSKTRSEPLNLSDLIAGQLKVPASGGKVSRTKNKAKHGANKYVQNVQEQRPLTGRHKSTDAKVVNYGGSRDDFPLLSAPPNSSISAVGNIETDSKLRGWEKPAPPVPQCKDEDKKKKKRDEKNITSSTTAVVSSASASGEQVAKKQGNKKVHTSATKIVMKNAPKAKKSGVGGAATRLGTAAPAVNLSTHPHAASLLSFGLGRAVGRGAAIGGVGDLSSHPHAASMINMGSLAVAGAAGVIPMKKGRQRLGPQKKRLTTLKKRVLQERLLIWREMEKREKKGRELMDQAEMATSLVAEGKKDAANLDEMVPASEYVGVKENKLGSYFFSQTVCLINFIAPNDELVDGDEYEEIESDLVDMAEKVGPISGVLIPRKESTMAVFVAFFCFKDACAAAACWNGMTLGGQALSASLVRMKVQGSLMMKRKTWEDAMLSYDPFSMPTPTMAHKWGMSKEIQSQEAETDPHTCSALILENVLTEDDLEDEECLEETKEDIRCLASKFGNVMEVCIDPSDSDGQSQIIVQFVETSAVNEAAKGLDGTVLGGKRLVARPFNKGVHAMAAIEKIGTIILDNVLTEDDFEDKECLAESKEDIKILGKKYGEVVSVEIKFDSKVGARVYLSFKGGIDTAMQAVEGMDGSVIGGERIRAQLLSSPVIRQAQLDTDNSETIVLENILTDDDLEDEECLEESKDDIRALAEKYGKVDDIIVKLHGKSKGRVCVLYKDGRDVALKAAKELNGMVLCGEKIIARVGPKQVGNVSEQMSINNVDISGKEIPTQVLDSREDRQVTNASEQVSIHNGDLPGKEIPTQILDSTEEREGQTNGEAQIETPKPMYSGNKIIPEHYAACKRVPKLPNPGVPRPYASRIDDDNVVPLLNELLKELMRLQLRSRDDKNARARRRLVMGLREVSRGIRAHKVKMVVMANNLDEYGVIDTKLEEILELARAEDLPVFFEFNKRKLGKALGKSVKVSVVGIQNADGAYESYKKLKRLAEAAPRKASAPQTLPSITQPI